RLWRSYVAARNGDVGHPTPPRRDAASRTRPSVAARHPRFLRGPSARTDPNWLLSSTAQSAAALVAIVGGFLVSRVITLSTERQGLERRLRAAEVERVHARRRLDEASGELLDEDIDSFLGAITDELIERRGELTLEDAVAQHGVGRTAVELQTAFEAR